MVIGHGTFSFKKTKKRKENITLKRKITVQFKNNKKGTIYKIKKTHTPGLLGITLVIDLVCSIDNAVNYQTVMPCNLCSTAQVKHL